ncbi:MAG: hypothetical protein DBX59_09845 [Bacillota bacterium]|nr:MAG: hypothetical protein DBX59_09845 [Bacillota bacterium]
MKEYILSIVSVILLTAAVGIILPEGKTGKFIKGIFALATLVVILTPLAKSDAIVPSFDTEYREETACDEDFLDYIYYKESRNYADVIAAYVKEKGYDSEVRVLYKSDDYQFKITKVTVNLKNSGISGGDEHIYIMSEIKQAVAKYCEIGEEKVHINEVPE